MADNIPHGLIGYRKFKCPCDVCREANNEYGRQQYAKRSPAKKPKRPTNVTSIGRARGKVSQTTQQQVPKGMGIIEAAVIEETSNLASALDHPAMVATARAMARVLDDQKQITQHATCSRQLTQILQMLSSGTKKKSKGRLARVTSMTSGRVAE
jgi:hypothetical protein